MRVLGVVEFGLQDEYVELIGGNRLMGQNGDFVVEDLDEAPIDEVACDGALVRNAHLAGAEAADERGAAGRRFRFRRRKE